MTGFKDLFDLKGRTAVVTGGCGILGQRFADGLAEFGANVALLDLDEQALQRAASEISSRHDGRARKAMPAISRSPKPSAAWRRRSKPISARSRSS